MRKQLIIITFMAIITICCLVYTIVDQQEQIDQLEQQLQEVQRKYEIIKNDTLARDAMEAGG